MNKLVAPREFRIYKPKKDGHGAAAKFQVRTQWIESARGARPDLMLFLEVAPQTGMDDNNNASFDWTKPKGGQSKSITIKLGLPDVGELLAVCAGKKQYVGPPPKEGYTLESGLFHQNKNGNATIRFKWDKGQIYLNVSSKKQGDKEPTKCGIAITLGEALVLEQILKDFVSSYHQWEIV